ncbi:MAG: hypothetical protein SGJ21_12175 [Alphaproteobacteria bacterium]|nr:hypothetical protein [Alphaproteobacteria bacterium]
MSGADIYRNPRAHRVRIAQAAFWVFGVVLVWLAFLDDSAVGSPGELIFVRAVGVCAIALILAFEVYLRLYVLRIREEGGALEIVTLATLHHRTFRHDPGRYDPGGDVLGATRRERSRSLRAPSVNVWWTPLRLRGRRLPLIIDETPPAKLDRRRLEAALRERNRRKS